ncbi:hypothetical protein [Larkinella soli]|uniref:hypothetical protein n=1 Tax=Larkinella soli TaxID=1770527 RepID=UPI000FFB1762|nr:hypothetical protein [Larkinella soli]
MLLIINGIYRGQTWSNLVLNVKDFSSAIEQVGRFVEFGLTLLSVRVRLKEKMLFLPVEVFDGQPFEKPVESMRRHWEEVLRTTVLPDIN